MTQYKPGILFLILFHVLLVIFLFSSRLGTVEISWQAFISALFDQNGENLASELIWQVRIPRFLMALLAGGTLAVAGQAMQILVRNPLADPYTMGTAGGAALGINVALSGFLPAALTSVYLIPFWGFAGAMLASFLILVLISKRKQVDNTVLLLIGVAVSILANSMLSVITFLAAKQNEVRHLLFWTFGNLDKANWDSLLLGVVFSGGGLLVLWRGSSLWNMLLLGDDKAGSLGIPVVQAKRILLVISALLTATIVCLVGPIGFVGLIVPFWIRKLVPVSQGHFWPVTFLTGAAFISLCDLVSRVVFQPFGLPIGLITSLVGVPFFLYLLRDSSQRSSF